MTVSAHFIRLLARNIASYHSLAPLVLNSVCTFDSVCVSVCIRLITYYFVEPFEFNRHSRKRTAVMLQQHGVMTQ